MKVRQHVRRVQRVREASTTSTTFKIDTVQYVESPSQAYAHSRNTPTDTPGLYRPRHHLGCWNLQPNHVQQRIFVPREWGRHEASITWPDRTNSGKPARMSIDVEGAENDIPPDQRKSYSR